MKGAGLSLLLRISRYNFTHFIGQVGELAETTSLLRRRTHFGYRGFESLPVRHVQKSRFSLL